MGLRFRNESSFSEGSLRFRYYLILPVFTFRDESFSFYRSCIMIFFDAQSHLVSSSLPDFNGKNRYLYSEGFPQK